MHWTQERIKSVAERIVERWEEKGLAKMNDPASVTERITSLIQANLDEEVAIHKEAQRLFQEARRKAGGMNLDEERALALIRKQLAKDRGFVF